MDLQAAFNEYIAGGGHMSLGTCVNNKPWVCEVHFVYDDDRNLYFFSDATRRHSQEIAQNPNVSGTIHEQHGSGVKPRGLYYEGSAATVELADEATPIIALFKERHGYEPKFLPAAQAAEGPQLYKVTVSDWYMFDARESSPSQKYHL